MTTKKSGESAETVKQQYASLSADDKLDLWKNFKVICFAKITLLIYCWSFISISIPIQMSILAGNMFISKHFFDANASMFSTIYGMIFPSQTKTLLNENFQLGFINFTLKQIQVILAAAAAIPDLSITMLQLQLGAWAELSQKASRRIVGPVSLKAMLTADDIGKILTQIRDNVHNDILEMFLHGLQLQTGNKLVEAQAFDLFADVFESSGIGHADSLIALLSKRVALCVNQKMLSSRSTHSETDAVFRAPLAKLLPFLWISFANGDREMCDAVRDFTGDARFRFMLFSSYENAMETFGR